MEKAKETGDLEKAKQTLDETNKAREAMTSGSPEYDQATEKIEKLEAAIKTFEDAQKAQEVAKPNSPEYREASQQVDNAQAVIKQLLKELGAGENNATQQSSQNLDKATTTLESTKIETKGTEKVAGPPEAANSQQQIDQKQQQLKKTIEQLEKSAEAESDAKNQLVTTVTELQSQQTAIINRLKVVLDEFEKKGGNTEAYRQYIQSVSGVELDTKDIQGMGLRLLGWVISEEGGLRWANNASKFLGILVATTIVSQFLGIVVNRLLSLFGGTSNLMRNFIVILIKRGGIVLGLLLALTALEVSLGPILALVGGISFVLAFALQSNLGNLASGLMIMAYKPFDVGDEIKVGGIWGVVNSISLANTRIKGFGGEMLTIPNNAIWGDTIENFSQGNVRQLKFQLRIAFNEDLARVEQLLVDTMKSHPKVVEDPSPKTTIFALEDYNVVVNAIAWTNNKEYWSVRSDVIRAIREQLDKEGVKLAIPKMMQIQEADRNNGNTPHLTSEIYPSRPASSISEPPVDYDAVHVEGGKVVTSEA